MPQRLKLLLDDTDDGGIISLTETPYEIQIQIKVIHLNKENNKMTVEEGMNKFSTIWTTYGYIKI